MKFIGNGLLLSCAVLAEASNMGALVKKDFQQPRPQEISCERGAQPLRIDIRHIEGGGVGYNQGYSTLGIFYAPNLQSCTPFLDLRGHLFDNGKMAANAGLGVRFANSRVYGFYAYYDYRETSRMHYNQASLGFETLGKYIDFRMNGYLPFGEDVSGFYGKRFDRFKGNRMIIVRKRQFAMRGLNGEIGAHLFHNGIVDLYAAAGPYYFQGRWKHAIGGEGRIVLTFYDYLRLEGIASCDNLYGGLGQGQLSINIPLGGKQKVDKSPKRSCKEEITINKCLIQQVDRNEIIVVNRKKQHHVAKDPLTNQPYTFWFVDNRSHSAGTYESPFPTLIDAQITSKPNEVIYVLAGDGSTSGMDMGIRLQASQQLLGGGIDQTINTTLGNIVIPAHSNTNPVIQNVAGAAVVLANNNRVSGFTISSTSGVGISGGAMSDATIENNLIQQSGAEAVLLGGAGLSLTGTITIRSNQITNTNHQKAFSLRSDSGSLFLLIENNHVVTGSNCVECEARGTSKLTSSITSNTFVTTTSGDRALHLSGHDTNTHVCYVEGNTCTGPDGIFIEGKDNTVFTGQFIQNTLLNCTTHGMVWDMSLTSFIRGDVISNVFTDSMTTPDNDFIAEAKGASGICLSLTNNVAPSLGYYLRIEDSGKINLNSATNNVGTIQESMGVTTFPICPISP